MLIRQVNENVPLNVKLLHNRIRLLYFYIHCFFMNFETETRCIMKKKRDANAGLNPTLAGAVSEITELASKSYSYS